MTRDEAVKALRQLRASAVLMRIGGAAVSLVGLMIDPSNFSSLGEREQQAIVALLGPLSEFGKALNLGLEALKNVEGVTQTLKDRPS
jgi:hypothetical protein